MPGVLETVQLVESVAEKIKNDGVQEFPIAATIGDAVRQGDIYIQLIEPVESVPVFYTKVLAPEFPYQLAPGNTKGSRHCLENSPGIEIYVPEITQITENADSMLDTDISRVLRQKLFDYSEAAANATPNPTGDTSAFSINNEITDVLAFSGPIFVVKNTTKVTHPEHGDWVLPPGTYRCVFQRTISSVDNVVRRVLD